jgi:hypothetical protein
MRRENRIGETSGAEEDACRHAMIIAGAPGQPDQSNDLRGGVFWLFHLFAQQINLVRER